MLIEQGVDLMIGVNDWLWSKFDRLTLFNSDYWLHTKVNIVEGKCFNIWKMLKYFSKNNTDPIPHLHPCTLLQWGEHEDLR